MSDLKPDVTRDEIRRLKALADDHFRNSTRLAGLLVASEAEVARLRTALARQSDNMAFVINHFDVPAQWYTKFSSELEEDRATLSPVGGG